MNTWTRLEDGTWGVSLTDFYPTNLREPGRDVNAGLPVSVKTKSGETKTVILGDFVKSYRGKRGIVVKVYRVATDAERAEILAEREAALQAALRLG